MIFSIYEEPEYDSLAKVHYVVSEKLLRVKVKFAPDRQYYTGTSCYIRRQSTISQSIYLITVLSFESLLCLKH